MAIGHDGWLCFIEASVARVLAFNCHRNNSTRLATDLPSPSSHASLVKRRCCTAGKSGRRTRADTFASEAWVTLGGCENRLIGKKIQKGRSRSRRREAWQG
ncbi:hypothetical protein K491DRAFT_686385 [Lophiostoma macrostomum CBS 122681]|uniref:Uncharacterized protein n=1 Tax=Lophiostoma macrostomum CBS 122681 TaxID=1314788 RepID=A0A6A6TTK4_9PLEO|nr:hypothetical protein K491DRAFT_686385 [Lophiostoma macrostomum CBS 122681]